MITNIKIIHLHYYWDMMARTEGVACRNEISQLSHPIILLADIYYLGEMLQIWPDYEHCYSAFIRDCYFKTIRCYAINLKHTRKGTKISKNKKKKNFYVQVSLYSSPQCNFLTVRKPKSIEASCLVLDLLQLIHNKICFMRNSVC